MKNLTTLLIVVASGTMFNLMGAPSQPATDLQVTKTAGTNTVSVGGLVPFLIGITNLGSTPGTNVTVTDLLPPGLAYSSSGASGGTSYDETNGAWLIPFLFPGNTYTLALTAVATSAGTFTNTATITGSTPGNTNATGNSASASVTANAVTLNADLLVTKTAGTNAISVGGLVSFFIGITNVGATPATNVTVTDLLPAGLAYNSSISSGGTSYNTNGAWSIPYLYPDNSYTLTITAEATRGGTFTNTATITGSMPANTNTAGNSASAIVTAGTVTLNADLLVTKTAGTNAVSVGGLVSFFIGITNLSATPATNVIVTDLLPAGLAYNSSISSGGTSYNTNGAWSIPYLYPDNSYTLTITAEATSAGTFTNTATITGSMPANTNTAGNSASASVTAGTVTLNTDLLVTKTAGTNAVSVGSLVPFFIGITNVGATPATNVTVTDLLPPGLAYSSSGASGGTSYNETNGAWFIPFLYPGNGYMLTITAEATSTGTFTNTANITGSSPANTNTAGNSASAMVTASATTLSADLQVTKTVSPTNAAAGQQVVFTIGLENLGPNNVTNEIVLTDCLPPGMEYVTDSTYGGGGIGVYSPGTCWWTLAGLGTNATVYLTITAVSTNAGSYTNTATVAVPSGYTDPNLSNNTASAVVTIKSLQSDLAVTKTASAGVVNTNSQVQFTVTVQNNGPDPAANIVIQDNLPAGLVLVSSNPPAGTIFNGGTGAWSIPSLTNGASAALVLTVTSTIAGSYTNVAFVASSGSTDTNLLNNTNSATVIYVAGQAADLAVLLIPTTNAVPVGGTFVLECIVTNLGPNSPTNVSATLTYPPGMTISAVGGPYGNATFNTNSGVLALIGALLPTTSDQVNLVFTVTNAGTFTPNFQITSSSLPDPILANNSASVTITGLVSYAISGGISSCSGSMLTNLPVILTGPNSLNVRTNTGTNGVFTFSPLLPGNYTVTPGSSNYFYMPANMAVAIVNSNVTLTNFIALPAFISGTVLQGGTNGTPVFGVTMLLTGPLTLTNTTDTNGFYSFTNLMAGTYTVTPQTNGFLGMVFSPTNAVVSLGSVTNCGSSANFITTNTLIVLRAIEVQQVIQDWSNSVTLIANKATIVRAHLQLYGTNTTPVLVDNARLYAQNLAGGSASWAPDNGRITVITNNCAVPVIRSNINMSLNFTVRNGFNTGSDIFRFTWTNGIVFNAEPADVAGDVASNGQVKVNYSPATPLGVRFIRVALTNAMTNIVVGVSTNITIVTNLATPAQIEEQKRRIISIYPITQVTNLMYGFYLWSKSSGAPTDEGQLLDKLNAARLTSSDTNGVFTNRIWYGVLPQGTKVRGRGFIPGYVSEGCISASPQNYQRQLAAHELGHNFGRPHSVNGAAFGQGTCPAGQITGHCEECAAGGTAAFPMVDTPAWGLMPTLGPYSDDNQVIWGYDTYQEIVISPYYYYDLMSYCYGTTDGFPPNGLGPWPWNSKFTYTNLYAAIQSRFVGGAAVIQGLPEPGHGTPGSPMPAGSPSGQSYLLVRGEIDNNTGTATFEPFYPIPGPLPVTPGPFTLVVLNTNAAPIYELPFTPDVMEGEFGDEPTYSTFDLSIPMLSGASAVEIYSNDVPAGGLGAPEYSPYVQVLGPVAGQLFGDTDVDVEWTGSDPNGLQLDYLVQFSPDGGNTWDTMSIDLTQTNLDIPPDSLAATTNGYFQVIASDGFNTFTAPPVGPITISNHIPVITILQPGSGSLFYGDQTIVFEADAFDLEDGPLDGTNVLWSSSLDGPLGSGATLPLETVALTQGVHIVTATAIANSGLTNSASVQIIVLSQAPPQLSIQLISGNQVQLSWPSSYTNYVLQTTTNLLPAYWNVITNVPAISNIVQSVNVNVSNTNQFFRLQMQ